MTARLFPTSVVAQNQQRAQARANLTPIQTAEIGAPWEGLTPDLPNAGSQLQLVESTVGLVAKVSPLGGGEVLMNDVGFEKLTSLNAAPSPPAYILPLGKDSNTTNVIMLIADFPLVDNILGEPTGIENLQTVVITAGDANTSNPGSCEMWRMDPVSLDWTEIPWRDESTSNLSAAPVGGRDGDTTQTDSVKSMPDWAVFASGAPGRAGTGGVSGNIAQPAFVWTNNFDQVFVYPVLSNTFEFGALSSNTVSAGATDDSDFRCISVESFGDRMYFFNTFENTVRYRQRLRRSARGTCDPDNSSGVIGAGRIDLDQFSGAGLRIETLGNVLACYLQDGVAFIHETGQASAPNRVQVIDKTRGLLGTHSMTPISNSRHFGIFTDGWWFLDAGGRWQEAGVANFNGKVVEKWRKTFDSLVDMTNAHRIHCYYDQERNWVRIVVPRSGQTETTETWIYDIDSDRVWTIDYPTSMNDEGGVTVWGEVVLRTTASATYANIGGTYSSLDPVATYGSFGAEAGNRRLAHGTHKGFVHFHTENHIELDGQTPPWSYNVVPSNIGNSRSIGVLDRICVEHINSGNNGGVTIKATSGRASVSESTSVSLNQGVVNDIELASAHFRISDEKLGFQVSGSGAVRIRGFGVDVRKRSGTHRRML